MASFASLPSVNPSGQNLSVDEVQIHRVTPQDYGVIDSIGLAFEFVKAKPVETILSGVILFFAYFAIYMIGYVATMVGVVAISVLTPLLMEINEILANIVLFGVMSVIYLLFFAITIIAQTVCLGAYWVIWLRIVRGQTVGLENIKDVVPFIKPLIFTALCFTGVVMGGALMLLIPAYIFMLGFWFAQVLVVDKNLSPINAMKASWRLSNGHKLNLLGYFFLTGVMNMVAMIPCGLGWFASLPITLGGLIIIYDRLAEPGNAYAPESQAADVFS